MKNLREAADKYGPGFQEAYASSCAQAQKLLSDLFARLSWDDQRFQVTCSQEIVSSALILVVFGLLDLRQHEIWV